jgi:hypothetical protein
MNTLRRVIYELIPCYAFDKRNIIINKSDLEYNNDEIRLRLQGFPIWGVDNNINNLSLVPMFEHESN